MWKKLGKEGKQKMGGKSCIFIHTTMHIHNKLLIDHLRGIYIWQFPFCFLVEDSLRMVAPLFDPTVCLGGFDQF